MSHLLRVNLKRMGLTSCKIRTLKTPNLHEISEVSKFQSLEALVRPQTLNNPEYSSILNLL